MANEFNLEVTKRNLSTDKDVVLDYFKDPLVFRTFTFRLGAEIAFVQDYVQENINRLTIPTIVLHGDTAGANIVITAFWIDSTRDGDGTDVTATDVHILFVTSNAIDLDTIVTGNIDG